jgi:hypothetical protein
MVIYGFAEAKSNQVPIKNEKGEIEWIALASVAKTGLIDDLQQEKVLVLDGGGAPV